MSGIKQSQSLRLKIMRNKGDQEGVNKLVASMTSDTLLITTVLFLVSAIFILYGLDIGFNYVGFSLIASPFFILAALRITYLHLRYNVDIKHTLNR